MLNQDTNHDKIVSLLPWFVNQTLDADQRRNVLNHVEHCDVCQLEIHFLETLNHTVQTDARKKHDNAVDVEKSFANVMNRIDENSQKNRAVIPGVSLMKKKFNEIFEFSTALPFPQWSATALAGLLVAVIGVQLYQGQSTEDYSVLSSPELVHASMRLSVEIAEGGDRDHIESTIQFQTGKIGQQVTVETHASGSYTLVFEDSVGVAAISKLVTALESDAQIERVNILP